MTLSQHIRSYKLARLLDVSPRTIRHWANDPIAPLPSKKIRGVLLFDTMEVQRWLAAHQHRSVDVDATAEQILEEMKGA